MLSNWIGFHTRSPRDESRDNPDRLTNTVVAREMMGVWKDYAESVSDIISRTARKE
jgi:hypothetical protein